MAESSFTERLKRIIKELGVSQAEFARSVGVTRNYMYYLTGGRRQCCSRSLAMLIEQKYGYSADWLLYGRESDEDLAKKIAQKLKNLDAEALENALEYIDKLSAPRLP
ncbi:MAG: helix-turn-helix domain-containing protein [Gracilibacteraceae bacterium]|nr:helix-turn-helix domain-containing protein [Gracilibacteraceae bacterium]